MLTMGGTSGGDNGGRGSWLGGFKLRYINIKEMQHGR